MNLRSKISVFYIATMMAAAGAIPLQAAEPVTGTPDFLLKFHFATSESACVEVGETDDLMINEIGIFGQEFGCKFLDFVADREEAGGEAYLYVARVNCGDDGGINRPDMITIIHDDFQKLVTVQSQNEFIIEEAVRMSGFINGSKDENAEPLDSYVSRDYKMCETN